MAAVDSQRNAYLIALGLAELVALPRELSSSMDGVVHMPDDFCIAKLSVFCRPQCATQCKTFDVQLAVQFSENPSREGKARAWRLAGLPYHMHMQARVDAYETWPMSKQW